jgi:hypothetical protein
MRPIAISPLPCPEQRRHAVAVLLATGLLRRTPRQSCLPSPGPENLAESEPDCLEVPGETRLSVHSGLQTEPTEETEERA